MTEFAPEQRAARFRRRVVVAGLFMFACLALLAARFHHLQVVRHEYYLTRAEDNRIALMPVSPNRGAIVDRNGVPLARNYSAYTLEITPSAVADLGATIDALGEIVAIDERDRQRF